jgi:hypothetical protein
VEGREGRREEDLERRAPPRLPFQGWEVSVGRRKVGHARSEKGIREFQGKGRYQGARSKPQIVERLKGLGPFVQNTHKRIGGEIFVGIPLGQSLCDEMLEALERVEWIGAEFKRLFGSVGAM